MATKKAETIKDDKTVEQAAKAAEEEIKNSKTVDIEGEPTEARKTEDEIAKSKEAETPETAETTEEEHFAKSGKKSKKHIEEVKAEEERQAKKAEAKDAQQKPKGAAPIVRPKIERRGKKYQEVAKLIENGKNYNLKDAVALAVKTSPVKFDASLEAHVRLGVDPRQADQNIRTTLVLPNGSGKTVKVAVFAPLDEAKKAKAAGADIAEDEEFLKRLEKGTIDFDVLISTPAYMPKLGKFARLLGPKGLMPNPKAGTVTTDIEKAVKEAKAGKVEYRVDKQSIVHLGLGKVSFGEAKLLENATAFFDSLKAQKPASIKGAFVKSIFLTTSQGPSIQVENFLN